MNAIVFVEHEIRSVAGVKRVERRGMAYAIEEVGAEVSLVGKN